MENISKEELCIIIATRPHAIIGREIKLKHGELVNILDVSLGGNYMLVEDKTEKAKRWIGLDQLGDYKDSIIEIMDFSPRNGDEEIISVRSLYDIIGEETKKIVNISTESRKIIKEISKTLMGNKPSKIIDFEKKKKRAMFDPKR